MRGIQSPLGARRKAPFSFTVNPPDENTSFFLGPGTATSHTLSARVLQSCAGAGENITLNQLSIDVASIR